MTKAQTVVKKGKKELSMGVKDGAIVKKKNEKFKKTPVGKVALINPKKKQQNVKDANGTSKLVPKAKGNKRSPNQDKIKKNKEPENDADLNSKDDKSMETSGEQNKTDETVKNKGVKMFKGLKNKGNNLDENEGEDVDEDDDEDEDDDVEGSDEEECSENSSDDDGDENDDDASSDDDEYQALNDSKDSKDDDEDDEDDDEDEDDDDEDDDDKEEAGVGLKALLGDSLADDEDDDDFEGEDEDEDDDDDDENEDEDDEEETGIGLKALLGDSLVDDEDDDDFEGEDEEDDDDDDISDESDEDNTKDENIVDSKLSKKTATKNKKESPKEPNRLTEEQRAELNARTIYVGNIPKDVPIKDVKKLFREFGEIDNLRIRGVVPEDGKMSPKVATITKKLHPKIKTIYVYITFKNEASAKEALKLNGYKLGDNILRVDLSDSKNKERDPSKAVFLGNLPFGLY